LAASPRVHSGLPSRDRLTSSNAATAIREANALLDDAGISLDSDPRRVAKSGSAQNAAQMAVIEIAATAAAMPARPQDTQQQG